MKNIFIYLLISAIPFIGSAQVAVSDSGGSVSPDSSAVLDLMSETRGFLPPRLTTEQIKDIAWPAPGLIVFNTDSSDFYGYDGVVWKALWDYPDDVIRSCPDSLYFSGQWYSAVEIGDLCWMSENLNVGMRIDGSQEQQDNSQLEKYCYNDDEANCDTYGGLYQWGELVQYLNGADNTTSWDPVPTGHVQGVCPASWHITTDQEWMDLEGNVDSQYGVGSGEWENQMWRGYDAGANLKVFSFNGNDQYDFSAMATGYRDENGNFGNLGGLSYFWTASQISATYTWYRGLILNDNRVFRYYYLKTLGNPVRCVRDYE